MYNLKFKIWLDKEGKVFGPGPYELLKGVRETGSLSKAASSMHMSYSQAYNLIKSLEKRLGFPLIISQSGGKKGGGSALTPEAAELVDKYAAFYKECEEALQNIFEKYFK